MNLVGFEHKDLLHMEVLCCILFTFDATTNTHIINCTIFLLLLHCARVLLTILCYQVASVAETRHRLGLYQYIAYTLLTFL